MKAKVILNPYASRWKGSQRRDKAEGALKAAGVDYELEVTTGPHHGIEIARQAVESGFDPIIAAGGDGTISEIVNGMLKATNNGTRPALGILPLGTANDLADNLGLPKEISTAAQVIAKGRSRLIDVIQVNEQFFINNAGLGLESFISVIQSGMVNVHGNLRYVLATLRGIAANPSWKMKLEWDGGSYEGPVTLISIGNCARTGGVFYTVPHADSFDGKLTFIYGYLPTRLKIMIALPMLFKPEAGNITEHPKIEEVHGTWLKVHATPPTPAHADGEVFGKHLTDLDYRVRPEALPILLP